MTTARLDQFTLWTIGQQEITLSNDGGRIVSDAGLLTLRDFEKRLGVLHELAQRLPDPRSQKFITHSAEAILTQQVYQILAGYDDYNDAQQLRDDPVLQAIVGVTPDEENSLASGSTLARFQYAYTRREAEKPIEERAVLLEQQHARNQRLQILNDYLPELFARTRKERPSYVIVDIDASDDPTHGQQVLSFYHGYYEQHQYFPLFLFDGDTGFPLGAWLRPGTVHASCGAVDALRQVVTKLRQALPGVLILVRGDTGLAVPEMYDYCEQEGLLYALGFATNNVLKEMTDPWLAELQEALTQHPNETVRRFEEITDYQAATWLRGRRLLVKLEVNHCGTNRRFVISNMSGDPQGLYHGFYVQRGAVPEQPIGELKNGLNMDRLSSHGFRANSFKLLEHVMAYALVVLYREASASVPEMARAQVSTWRLRLWKVGALLKTSVRRIWFHLSETWPHLDLLFRVHRAALAHLESLRDALAGATRPLALPPPDTTTLPLS
jgi:Transposase DDE domain group 1